MSKIKRASDELWMPPSVRRTPIQPPTGRRFLNRRGCCCETGCPTCTCSRCIGGNGPATFLVTIAGVTNLACGTSCQAINRQYTLNWLSNFCVWNVTGLTDCDSTHMTIRINIGFLRVTYYTAEVFTGIPFNYIMPDNGPYDCSAFSGLVATRVGGNFSTQCDFSSATATITSG